MRFLRGGADLDEKFLKEAVNDSVTKFCSVIAALNERAKPTFSYEIVQA